MNGDADEVWPPPPRQQDGVEAFGRSKPRRFVTAFGSASLALTLPGFLLCVLLVLNGYVMRWAFIPAAMSAFSYFSIAFVLILPLFGFCTGVAGWNSVLGKLGVAASVLNYGYVFVGFWIDAL